MSKKNEIEEVTLISDDEDEPKPTEQAENVVTKTSSTTTIEEKKEDKTISNKFTILKETLQKPTLNHDPDSDCEITEIPIEKPKEVEKEKPEENIPDEIPTPVVTTKEQEPIASTSDSSKNYKSIEIDEDITEIVVINKTTDTKNNDDSKMDVDKPVEEEEAKDDKVVEMESPPVVENPDDVIMISEDTDQESVSVSTETKVVKRRKCCNTDCAVYGYNFTIASSFMKAFYGVNESKEQVHRLCEKCVQKFERYEQELYKKLEEHNPIIDAEYKLPQRDTVLLEDSDDEMETEDVEVKDKDPDDEIVEVDLNELKEVLEATWASMHFVEQIDLCEQKAEANIEELNVEMLDLDSQIISLQSTLDNMRNTLYEPWNSIQSSLPQFEIPDEPSWEDEIQPPPSPVAVATKSTTTPSRANRVVAMKKVTQMRSPSTKSSDAAEILDLGEVDPHRPTEPLPPQGVLASPPPVVGQMVYAMKSTLFMDWIKARIIEIGKNEQGEIQYKVKFVKQSAATRWLLSKYIAYCEPPNVQLQVGTRIIAVFHNLEDESNDMEGANKDSKKHYYAGIIAEQLKTINRHRYLVFFDDGFTQYVTHSKVCTVVGQNRYVWEDCHPDCQDFTRTYVTQFPERPMVKLQKGQVVKTEWNTRWWLARVKKIDCSLVLVHFDADGRTEWIYRGSTRLGPLYSEMAKKTERQKKGLPGRAYRSFGPNFQRNNQPFVEYTRGENDNAEESTTDEQRNLTRSVAKKSTGGRQVEGIFPPPTDRKENVGLIQELQEITNQCPTPNFRPHQCGKACVAKETFKEGTKVLQNPLLIPIQQGWARECVRFKDKAAVRTIKTHSIFYVATCGRRLRTILELQRYLRITKSSLGIDLFCFDPMVYINTEFVVADPLFQIKDISYGKENVVIPCVNTINHHEYPAYVEYATKRMPTAGVYIDSDPGFLVCCDCTDGCQNKSKCACHKLTLEHTKDKTLEPDQVGYSYRRLNGERCSAIYECNSQCKCKETCLNRVVQHPMKVQLQLFKTEKRGWGIRAVNDIPSGTFLCIYAGQLLTELGANEEGKTYGDEYLAELDYIEVIEREKFGYEEDVTDIEDSDDSDPEQDIRDTEEFQDGSRDNDTEFTVDNGVTSSLGEPSRSMTLRQRNLEKSKKKDDAERKKTDEREKKSGEVKAPRAAMDSRQSVRYLFDGTEDIYVMDAKGIGNIGRYFNHSCDPNVIVQNVFVDTHDLRYPWVAFFTSKFCRAGTELCWNYNYEIGSLPDRKLECFCESFNCKGRLL